MEARPVKLSPVCTKCREKHLRCDGAPRCTRCKKADLECVFVPSRRGKRPIRSSSTKSMVDLAGNAFAPASRNSIIPSLSSSPSPLKSVSSPSRRRSLLAPQKSDLLPGDELIAPSLDLPTAVIDSFYALFLPAQQFIVPQQVLLQRITTPDLCYLRAVIEYIGSTYCSPARVAQNRYNLERYVLSQNYPINAYTVQALLLLAFWFAGGTQHAQATRFLGQARSCASSIGMDQDAFASGNSNSSEPLEQSWRSTWQVITQMNSSWSLDASQASYSFLPLQASSMRAASMASVSLSQAAPSSIPEWNWQNDPTEMTVHYEDYTTHQPGHLRSHSEPHLLPVNQIFDGVDTFDLNGLRSLPVSWEALTLISSSTSVPTTQAMSWNQ